MTQLDIRQLAENGGVNPIAPVTVPEAVKFEDGADLNTAIGSIAVIETSPATATHAVGDYIVWNGQVYKVTAAIAIGETLSTSTNVSATNLGSELTYLTELLPTQGKHITLGNQGATFTVPHTGFYILYAGVSSSSSYMTILLNDVTRGRRVGSVYSTSGISMVATVFIEAGHTISILTRANVSEAYLYY